MAEDEGTTQYDGEVDEDGHALIERAVSSAGSLRLSVRAVMDLLVEECTDAELRRAMLEPRKSLVRRRFRCRLGLLTRDRLALAAKQTGTRVNASVDSLLRWLSKPDHEPRIWQRLGEAARRSAMAGGAE